MLTPSQHPEVPWLALTWVRMTRFKSLEQCFVSPLQKPPFTCQTPWAETEEPPPGTYPEVNPNCGNEAAGEESAVFEPHQQAGFADPRVAHQHHLRGRGAGVRTLGFGKEAPSQPLPIANPKAPSKPMRTPYS